jgi:hypothetical protein
LSLGHASPATLARRAAKEPIRHCLLQGALEDGAIHGGIGTIMLVRGSRPHQLIAAIFLVDTLCLGIKDAFIREVTADDVNGFCQRAATCSAMCELEPALARKFIHDAAAWASSFGFEPHRSFAAIEPAFGDVSAEDCDEVFEFGLEVRPHYVPGPTETAGQVRRRFTRMLEILGPEDSVAYAALMADWANEKLGDLEPMELALTG